MESGETFSGLQSCFSAELHLVYRRYCCLGILRNCLYQELYSKGKIPLIKKYGSLKHEVKRNT